MLDFTVPRGSFDSVVALYSAIYLPLFEQPDPAGEDCLVASTRRYLLMVVGYTAWTGTEDNWLSISGLTMFWSHADAETYRAWLTKLRFAVLREEFIPEGSSGHVLFVARSALDTPAEPADTVDPSGPKGEVSHALLATLDDFVQEHCRCGELEGGVEEE